MVSTDKNGKVKTNETVKQNVSVPTVMEFANDSTKRDFLLAYRRIGLITSADIGLTDERDKFRIFVFEHLNSSFRKTYIIAKKFQKNNQYKYLWTRDGKIFLRRTDDSAIIRVMSYTDLSKINNSVKSNMKARKDGRSVSGGVSRD